MTECHNLNCSYEKDLKSFEVYELEDDSSTNLQKIVLKSIDNYKPNINVK